MIIQASTKHASKEKPKAKDDILLGGPSGTFTSWINIPKGEDDLGLCQNGAKNFGGNIGYFGSSMSYLGSSPIFPTGSVVTLIQE